MQRGQYKLSYSSSILDVNSPEPADVDNEGYISSVKSIHSSEEKSTTESLHETCVDEDNLTTFRITKTKRYNRNVYLDDDDRLLTNNDFETKEIVEINCLTRVTIRFQDAYKYWLDKHKRVLKILFTTMLICLYMTYFIWSCYCSFKTEDDIRLVWMTGFVVFCIVVYYIKRYAGEKIYYSCWDPIVQFINHKKRFVIFKWLVITIIILLILFVIIYLVAMRDPYRLVSISGIFVYIIIGFIFSHDSSRIVWRPIIWGLILQFIFALFILRTVPGLIVFKFLGDRITELLEHTNDGSKFLFGDVYGEHFIIFKVLPIVVFFSSTISLLYYLGVMHLFFPKVAWVMQRCMGTTAGESINAAANIFIGITESTLMIRPLLGKMTNSELHAVFTSGFATIAGTVLFAYISLGVPANHLLSASVMSAPAALAMSKLFYPEDKKSKTTAKQMTKMATSPYKNVVEAYFSGATYSIVVVASIVVNLISFVSFLSFINATLTWFGDRACLTRPLTFQLICSYLLWPLAVVMGVRIKDCRLVAELIGIKTFINEFVAYGDLGKLIKNREVYETFNKTLVNVTYKGNDIYLEEGERNVTLIKGFMEQKSEVIATYTLCGFANFGEMLSGLIAMVPHRRHDMSAIVIRALIAGNFACFLTACIAGLLYDGSVL